MKFPPQGGGVNRNGQKGRRGQRGRSLRATIGHVVRRNGYATAPADPYRWPMDAHRKLVAWQVCLTLAVSIYKATKSFPRDELFGLTAQLRRAGVSAPSNIAEGFARRGSKDLRRFLGISLGSLA